MTSAVPEPSTGTRCPLCAAPGGLSVHRIGSLPVHSCLLMDSREDALAVPVGSLDLTLCDSCGYLANRDFDERRTAYSDRYEDSQAFSGTFVSYATGLADHWVSRWGLADGVIVEVGAGRGDFSRMLSAAGAARVVAMDPTIDPVRFGSADPRVEPLVRRFDVAADLPACDAVVMRHVLEHVDDPVALLTQLRTALAERPEVPVLVEVPDATRILDEGAFWDVYYEHCAYLTPATVTEMFESCGFEVRDLTLAYAGQYLLVEATPTGTRREPRLSSDRLETLRASALGFRDSVGEELQAWRERLEEARRAGLRVVIWGSGSKGTAFLVAMGDLAEVVDRVVDINPHLHGRFVAGTGHRIVAPDELAAAGCDLVVVMNPVYVAEISALVESLSPGAQVVGLGADAVGSGTHRG
ncbi:class I SAM-dependent methyltransferase [Nocardioides sp. YIM 152315]|uniref:class I SAM-dependent methyltransferase n=1 Tax=Nocardioides sp. YIM 152315 TaxID=3031760 RepID=UPI0023DA4EF2|nr:class I SAM-dependent methyltransferase [Nocardioides sp. YIM 152315]MDF1603456.1 class I SAM-dependent methyltransferase [Nocardioides sp. YIM 152315]